MAEKCYRTGKPVYAADNPIRIYGLVFNPKDFTCAATGTLLTLKTVTSGTTEDGKKEVYMLGEAPHYGAKGKEPWIKPNQVDDVITQRVGAVPDANMRTTDRKFNIAGKAEHRGATDADAGSNYGTGAVAVDNQTKVTKPSTTVNNINLMEKRHNGTEGYTNAQGEAPAE